jgi:hypothetical protein
VRKKIRDFFFASGRFCGTKHAPRKFRNVGTISLIGFCETSQILDLIQVMKRPGNIQISNVFEESNET